MKKIYSTFKACFALTLSSLLFGINGNAQTLIDPAGDGGFETGTTFAANGWSVANGTPTTRVWYLGTGQTGYTGARGAFIGNNTTTVGSNTASRLVHLYKNISIPIGATNIQLSFKYKQTVPDETFDFLKVYMATATPVSGTAPAASGLLVTVDPNATTTYASFTNVSVTIPNTYAGTSGNLVFSFTSDAAAPHAYGALDDVSLTYTPAPDCTGAPEAGTAVASAGSVCVTENVTLSLTGISVASALAFQWQSSADGITYTNIAGATGSTYVTTQSAANYYQCIVTCTPSGMSDISSPVMVGSMANCYCTASATSTSTIFEKISNVTLNTLNNNSTSAAGYENFLSLSTSITKGASQTITVSTSNTYNMDQVMVFIDYNQNGLFTDAGETVFTSAISVSPYSGSFAVPTSATGGFTRMRVRMYDSSDGPNTTPCGTSTYGQVEDYMVNIICPSVPAPTAASVSTCVGNTAALSATSSLSGASFAWYDAASAGALLSSASSYTTGTLSANTTFWVEASIPGCPAGPRTAVNVTIDPVNASLVPVNVTCNGLSNGSFTLGTVICGTQPFTYSVNGGAYGAIPTNLAAGTYSVVIKDDAANVSTPVSITITQPSTTIANPSGTGASVCVGAATASISATSALSTISTGTQTISFNLAAQPTEASGLDYEIALSPNIISSAAMAALPTGAVVTSVNFSFPGLTTTGDSYGSDVLFGFTGAVSQDYLDGVAAPEGAGTFTFTNTYNNNAVNIAGGTVNLHYYDILNDNTGSETTFPTGTGVATLTINYSYPIPADVTWWTAATGGTQIGSSGTLQAVGTSVLPTTATAGTYSFYAEGNSGGCLSPARTLVTVVVNANPTPAITAGGPTTFCAGGNVVLTASSATGNVWSTTSTAQAITVSAAGSYTVTQTDANGCTGTSAPTVVTVNANPAVPVITADGPTTFCAGDNVVLSSSYAIGNVWSTGATATTQAITVTTAGSYTVTETDANGCSATSAPTTVTVNPVTVPSITASGPLTFCQGGSVVLTSSNASGNEWSTTATTPSITVTTPGSYTVTDNSGCGGTSAAVTVVVNALPAANAGADVSICAGSSVTLTATGAGTFSWDNGISQATPFTPNQTMTYTVTVDNGTCTNTDAVTVTVLTLPTVNAGADVAVCAGSSATLTATGTGTFSWDNGVSQAVPFVPTATTTYTVTVDNGTCTNTDFVTVTVNAPPTVNAGADVSVCAGSNVTLTATGTGTFTWNNGASQAVPFAPTATTTYTVTVNNGTCTNTDAVTVTVNPVPVAVATASGVTLTATPAGQASYQWINCTTNNSPIPGATSATYTATQNGSYGVMVTNSNGCSDMSNCVIVNSVGIEENTAGLNISLYPNPTEGQVFVTMPDNEQAAVTVYDAQGKLVLTATHLQNGGNIDLSNAGTGVYMVHVTTENGSSVSRIVKQ